MPQASTPSKAGWSQVLPTSASWSAVMLQIAERDEVEFRVAPSNVTTAQSLVLHLTEAFGQRSVSFDIDHRDVRVRAGRDLNRAIGEVLDAVEAWLSEDGAGSAQIRLGGRSYTMLEQPRIASGL